MRIEGQPRWRGSNLGPFLVTTAILIVLVVGARWTGANGGQPEPTPSATGAQPSSGPSAPADSGPASTARSTIRPVVTRTESIDALGPTKSASFPLGDLVSVSPDGRYALVWTATPEMIRESTAEIMAIPLKGGQPISIGIAGYERRGPDDSEDRLATPVWSSDSTRIAFENRASGMIVALDGSSREGFAARPDAPISPVTGGGFIILGPSGPKTVGGGQASPVALPPGLEPLGYLADGATFVAVNVAGELVSTNGDTVRTIAGSLDGRGWRVFARSGDTLVVAPEGRRLDFGVFLVRRAAPVIELELPDACGIPDVSDDGRFVAYTVCDNTGAADRYAIRLVRLEDGAAVDVGKAVASPRFIPGTHRLAWLTLSGGPPVSPGYTVSVATNEVSRFVATSSWKWKVMNVRPGRRPASIRMGASIWPRRDTTRTRSPSASPSRSASSGEGSRVSLRRCGEQTERRAVGCRAE